MTITKNNFVSGGGFQDNFQCIHIQDEVNIRNRNLKSTKGIPLSPSGAISLRNLTFLLEFLSNT